jgi:hypothetical protein
MAKSIVFYNNYHNGDIWYGKAYAKEIIDLFPEVNFTYHHNQSPKILKDLNIPHSPINPGLYDDYQAYRIDGDTMYINTWYYDIININYPSDSLRKGMWIDLNFSHHVVHDAVANFLCIPELAVKDVYSYIPDNDYDYFDIPEQFVSDYDNTIIFSNGPVHSGQSHCSDTTPIIHALLEEFPDKTIILTHRTSIYSDRLLYTDDIINTTEGDLNEISYLAYKHAKYILGRQSGPFQFMQTKRILNSPEKIVVGFGHDPKEAFTTGLDLPATCKNINDISMPDLINDIISLFKVTS